MRIVAISDTHSYHEHAKVPAGDVLVHAGDLTRRGRFKEIREFNEWLGTLPHRHKLIIAGNHDWGFQRAFDHSRELLTNGRYIQDESVTIEGINFYGSPWQPWFFDWAFNLPRGEALAEKWALIPSSTDVLITHGPPFGVLDKTQTGEHVGCQDLLEALARVRPRAHIFGHIHESAGTTELDGTTFINACFVDEQYQVTHAPVVIDL